MRLFYFNITYCCNSSCIFCAADHPIEMDDSQMCLSAFEKILAQNNVKHGDRVVVNGGEPTVHPEFFGFLDAIQACGAKIDLFTNGMRLQDEEFASHLLRYDNIYIRIPLFGASAEVHDKLTGCPGSFNKVVKGVDYVTSNLRQGIDLEIKMLLSKINVPENEKIYNLISDRWKASRIRISLNPLLISKCVIQHKEMFIDTYEAMMKKSEPLIRRIINDGRHFQMDLIPYCTFPNEDLIELCHGNTSTHGSYYADPNSKTTVDALKGRERCAQCKYINRCAGFPSSYIKYFGEEVMKPIR